MDNLKELEDIKKTPEYLATMNEVKVKIKKKGKKAYLKSLKEQIKSTIKTLEEPNKELKKVFIQSAFEDMVVTFKECVEFLDKVLENLEEVSEKELKVISEKCETLPNSPATNAIKMLISSFSRENIRTSKDTKVVKTKHLTGKTEVNFKSRNSDITLTIDRYDSLVSKQDKNTRKIFNFLLEQSNNQNGSNEIVFHLKDLVERGIYKNIDSARKGLKNCMSKLTSIKVEGKIKKGKREVVSSIQVLFTGMIIKNGNCIVDVNEKLDIEFLAQYITLIPRWTYKLNSIAYDIIDYIFYRARQSVDDIRKNGYFNVSLDSISRHIGQLAPNETKDHSKLIINPLLDAITEIEDTQKDINHLKITPVYEYDYKNAVDFLKGYLKIELGDTLTNYFIKRAIEKEKEISKTIKKIEAKNNKKLEAQNSKNTSL